MTLASRWIRDQHPGNPSHISVLVLREQTHSESRYPLPGDSGQYTPDNRLQAYATHKCAPIKFKNHCMSQM